ncbi:hypothetical protein [Vibrio metschnikovii]|uniref:hypothetical protein n=1 Tax=Vibrio metschnikovii TaxID=28172 RepID=UPI002FCA8383|nr:hypothetical protein [Vibrio metschnikovii]
MNCYLDDEGFIAELNIEDNLISFVYLEESQQDEYFNNKIQSFKSSYSQLSNMILNSIHVYINNVYPIVDQSLVNITLIKVYITPDEDEGDYGLMYSLDLDREHGIGIKLSSWKVSNIGSSEIAFM